MTEKGGIQEKRPGGKERDGRSSNIQAQRSGTNERRTQEKANERKEEKGQRRRGTRTVERKQREREHK